MILLCEMGILFILWGRNVVLSIIQRIAECVNEDKIIVLRISLSFSPFLISQVETRAALSSQNGLSLLVAGRSVPQLCCPLCVV